MAEGGGGGRAGSYPFYHSGPHHSKSHEQMPRYERRQGCVPQSTTHAAAWVENVEKEAKLHETLVRIGVRPRDVSYATARPVPSGRARAQYLTEEQRADRREYRNMKQQLKLEKRLRRAMAEEIAELVRAWPVHPTYRRSMLTARACSTCVCALGNSGTSWSCSWPTRHHRARPRTRNNAPRRRRAAWRSWTRERCATP